MKRKKRTHRITTHSGKRRFDSFDEAVFESLAFMILKSEEPGLVRRVMRRLKKGK